MPSAPAGSPAREFGRSRLGPELLGICRALRPLPRLLRSLEPTANVELGAVSEELLIEATVAGRADCIYAFCRLNADAVRDVAAWRVSEEALPIDLDAIVAEVLAEVADAVRFIPAGRVPELYRSIPSMTEQVITSAVDEVLGFVPVAASSGGCSRLADVLDARLDLPRSLLTGLPRVVDLRTTRIVAAQALLQLSANDRTRLLRELGGNESPASATPSVAELLSATAARRRFSEEFDRIARWIARALDGSTSQDEGEEGKEAP